MNKKESQLLFSAHHILRKAINEVDDPEEFELMLRQSLHELQTLIELEQAKTQRHTDRLLTKINGTKLELKGHPSNEPKFKAFMDRLKDGAL